MKIEVFVRNVYGNQLVYPANQLALQFAQLVDNRTFSFRQLDLIRALGVEVVHVTDPLASLKVQA
jgi:hypothetical protein